MSVFASLIVIRSAQREAALSFYRALGLEFVEEQHGSGPLHYACETGGMVLEIYPGTDGAPLDPKASGATMLGFQVESLEIALASLSEQGVKPKSAPKDAPWGRWINVSDPDGRVIQLTETPNGGG